MSVNPNFLISELEDLYESPTDKKKLELIKLICCTSDEELMKEIGVSFENVVRTINRPSRFLIDYMKKNLVELSS